MENKTRTIRQLVCQDCGRQFPAFRIDAKYCCDACRQQAYLTRSAPRTVEKLLSWIEDDFRDLETRRGYLTKQNLDDTFEKIRDLVNSWYYAKLPLDDKLRYYAEVTLVRKFSVLQSRLAR